MVIVAEIVAVLITFVTINIVIIIIITSSNQCVSEPTGSQPICLHLSLFKLCIIDIAICA